MSSDCSLCSNSLLAKTLPCGHSFHCPCIDQWIESSTSCPICRRNFVPSQANRSTLLENVECYVCLENIYGTKNLICGHEFHEACVNPVLVDVNKCPECSMFCGMDEELDLSVCKFCDEPIMDRELTLTCGHTVHEECAASWLREKKTCPECLMPLDESTSSNACSALCDVFPEITEDNEIIFLCGHRFHRTCSVSWNNCPTCGASVSEGTGEVCTFCSRRITQDETCLPCGHKFHEDCLAPWQREQKMCPNCLRPCEPPAFLDEACSVSSPEAIRCLLCSEAIQQDDLDLSCGHKFHILCFESWQGEQKKCPECLLPCDDIDLPSLPLQNLRGMSLEETASSDSLPVAPIAPICLHDAERHDILEGQVLGSVSIEMSVASGDQPTFLPPETRSNPPETSRSQETFPSVLIETQDTSTERKTLLRLETGSIPLEICSTQQTSPSSDIRRVQIETPDAPIDHVSLDVHGTGSVPLEISETSSDQQTSLSVDIRRSVPISHEPLSPQEKRTTPLEISSDQQTLPPVLILRVEAPDAPSDQPMLPSEGRRTCERYNSQQSFPLEEIRRVDIETPVFPIGQQTLPLLETINISLETYSDQQTSPSDEAVGCHIETAEDIINPNVVGSCSNDVDSLITSNAPCMICSLNITSGNVTLPCGHNYHKACLASLLIE